MGNKIRAYRNDEQLTITENGDLFLIEMNPQDEITLVREEETQYAASPVMGWSSCNTYHVNISDSLIMRQADAMADLGLRDAGYRYINIDDDFFGGRDESTGDLLFNSACR